MMEKLFLTGTLSLFLCTVALAQENRAVYVASYDTNTQAKCDTAIAEVLSTNLNQVFIQVRARADAVYFPNREDSTYPNPEPRGQLYTLTPSDLDVLQYYIDRLHNASPPVEVHAWMTTYNSWNRSTAPSSPDHVYNDHPDWITEKADGTTYTYSDDAPLDPGVPAVQDHLYNVFMDVVRNYDVDGIHFDYIRLLGADSGFDPVAKAAFEDQTGWSWDTDNTAGELDEVYEAWRRDQISTVVQRIHTQTLLEKPWVNVSAFLVNFSDSVEVLGQGYNWWVANDAIDSLYPGCYSSTVAGTVDDWDFYISKLAQNGDENKVPLNCAIGSYLYLPDHVDYNKTAVTTLGTNSRVPDGYNFFDRGPLFTDATGGNPREMADDLFTAGGPMVTWADPVGFPAHKVAMGAETTPPNAPASPSVTVSSNVPTVTFQRPAAASDGDLPVHYRLYRDTTTPSDLYYENMVMEWWDEDSSRSSFSYDDILASAGTIYYTIVAYDDWNNSAQATVSTTVSASPGVYLVESRTGGLNFSDYSEESGAFSNSSAHSLASGCTASIGSRFATPGAGGVSRLEKARFTPSNLATGTYNVYVTCFDYASAYALGITVRTNDGGGVSTTTIDLTAANAGDVWYQVGTINYTASSGHYIEFDNATQTNFVDATNIRMNAAAVKFESSTAPEAKEPKPAVVTSTSSATEVIVDSSPQALNYDDDGGSGAWATSTYGGAGYFNGSARYFSGSNTNDSVAVWLVDLPQSGKWAIDGWVRHSTGFSTQAKYRFVDGSGTTINTSVSQRSTYDSTTSGDWLINVDGVSDVSAYHFDAGHVYVTLLGDGSDTNIIIADGLRFRLLDGSSCEDWMLF